ncbi:MAG: ABC transporter ATP-binding protein [bacterium]|nr:ABC transporter ATP-binding protein [bacterium]
MVAFSARPAIHRSLKGLYFVRSAFGRYKKRSLLLIFLGFFSGLLEAVGVNVLIPLFAVFEGDGRIPTDPISRLILKLFNFAGIEAAILPLLGFIVLLFVFKALALLVFENIKIKIKTGYEYDVRNKMYRTALGANWSYLLKQRLGYLDTVLRIDVGKSALFLTQGAQMILVFTGLIMFLFAALSISETITLFTLVFGTIVFFIFHPLLSRARIVAGNTASVNREIGRHINESIIGMKVLKALSAERATNRISGTFFEELRTLQVRAFLLRRIPQILIQPLVVLFIAGIVAFSYYQTSYNLGALAAIVYLIQRIFAYIQELLKSANALSEAVPYLQNVVDFQQHAQKYSESHSSTGDDPFVFEENLSFNTLSFSYESHKKVLKDLSISIQKGSTVALVGPSGAGKTTIFDLLLRFFEPTSGSIALDGKNITDIAIASWRKNVLYVPQDMFMLGDTVRNNIRFFDEEVTDEAIEQAARDAHMYDVIMSLPKGFDTMIGERGLMLSVGQRQRIAIARVLARKPSVLLLDEATSALDIQSEQAIRSTLEYLKGKITVIMIAHRRSTLEHADTIFVLKDGKIVEHGSPQELHNIVDSYFSQMQ